uniref:Phytocyanin domain-containing protein n=1 Tax=Leersia perrieri TaxID=77586 RepID=A0A0D9VKG3_9ORYZ
MASLAVIAAAFLLLANTASSSPAVYTVGDERGWAVPSGNGTESYNHWARRNRFRVGDILEFKYVNDSLLVVNHDGYKQCSTASPVSRFEDGDTKFPFDHNGLFYFISGVQGHCKDGQRMIVRVKAESAVAGSPSSAPAPAPGPATTPSTSSPEIGAPTPAVIAPGTPSSPSPSTPTTSPSPSPGPAQASSASGRAISGFFSIAAAVLVVFVLTVLVLV